MLEAQWRCTILFHRPSQKPCNRLIYLSQIFHSHKLISTTQCRFCNNQHVDQLVEMCASFGFAAGHGQQKLHIHPSKTGQMWVLALQSSLLQACKKHHWNMTNVGRCHANSLEQNCVAIPFETLNDLELATLILCCINVLSCCILTENPLE